MTQSSATACSMIIGTLNLYYFHNFFKVASANDYGNRSKTTDGAAVERKREQAAASFWL